MLSSEIDNKQLNHATEDADDRQAGEVASERISVVMLLNQHAGNSFLAPRLIEVAEHLWDDIKIIKLENGTLIYSATAQAIRDGATLIIACGGDGTISAVANAILKNNSGENVILGIVPMGTLNHLARDLQIPLNPLEALNLIKTGTPSQIDVGMVNERYFVNTAVLGIYTSIVRYRQKHRPHLGSRLSLIVSSLLALRNPYPFRVTLNIEGETKTFKTFLVLVSNNSHDFDNFTLSKRSNITSGKLNLIILCDHRLRTFFKLVVRFLLRKILHSKEIAIYEVSDFSIIKHKKRINIACDGEIIRMHPPLYFKSIPGALKIITP